MDPHGLDNPIWSSLTSRHADLAIGGSLVRRYPPEVAPFVALVEPSDDAEQALLDITTPGETVCFLQFRPQAECWTIKNHISIVQFVWAGGRPAEEPGTELLSDDDLPAMLDLTALVYPAYFREGTARLGAYYGIKEGDRLCSMAGIRMAMDGYQEISAVCTHSEFRQRGYAARLIRRLVQHIQDAGDTPFLHTEAENLAARAMYAKLGFQVRTEIPFWVMERR
ncbi:MAG: GNAT family N-acetyltransferase [Fimbriimonadaceae bacterium]|nr:GNAT family N-acetyltransferase [Fimbriimonadaceae bacterium]